MDGESIRAAEEEAEKPRCREVNKTGLHCTHSYFLCTEKLNLGYARK